MNRHRICLGIVGGCGVEMRPLPIALFLAIAASSLAGPILAHTPSASSAVPTSLSTAARSAAAIVEAFHKSLQDGKSEAAAALLASNALIFESGGAEHSKAEYAEHHLPADAQFSKATTRTILRQSGEASGDMAWIATESRTTGTWKGRSIDSASTETMVLRRVGGDWKITHIHWSSGK